MATKYPYDIDDNTSLPKLVDGVSPMVVEDVNRLRDAVVAVQTELGADPSGTFTSVATRIAANEQVVSEYARSEFLVLSHDGYVSRERVFVPSANFLATDGGPGFNYELDLANVVGIGTSVPSAGYSLTLDGNGSSIIGGITLRNAGTDTFYIGGPAASDTTNIVLSNPNLGYISLKTDNTERARITATGDVGIGTLSPSARLHVSGGDLLVDTGNVVVDAGDVVVDAGDVGIGTSSPAGKLHVSGGNLLVDTGDVGLGTISPAGRLHIFGGNLLVDGGSVGIGTLTPSELLHISGGNLLLESTAGTGIPYATIKGAQGGVQLSTSGSVGKLDILDNSGTAVISLLNSGDNRIVGANNADFSFHTNSAERMRITATGKMLVNTTTNPDSAQLHVYGGDITHSSDRFNARPGSGANYEWVNSNGEGHTWYVSSAANQAMTLTGSGKLGIGNESTAPLAMLDVKAVGTREVAYFRTTDIGSSNQIAFANASNLAAGVIGTISGTGTAGNDVYALGHTLTPSAADFTPVVRWRSNGTTGINAAPSSSVSQVLRIQQAGEDNVGLTISRLASSPQPSMVLHASDEASGGFYRPLVLSASEVQVKPGGNTRAVVTTSALIVGGDDGNLVVPIPNGTVRSPDWESAGAPTNTAGSSLIISSGRSTGTALGGNIELRVASGGSSGSGLNSATSRVTVGGLSTSIVNPTISIQSQFTSIDSTLNLGAHAATTGTKTINIGTGSIGGDTNITIGASIPFASGTISTSILGRYLTIGAGSGTEVVVNGTATFAAPQTNITGTLNANGYLKVAGPSLITEADSTYLNREITQQGIQWLSAMSLGYAGTYGISEQRSILQGLELHPGVTGTAPVGGVSNPQAVVYPGFAMFPSGKVGFLKSTLTLTLSTSMTLLEGGNPTIDTLLYFYMKFDTGQTNTAGKYYLDGPFASYLPPLASGAPNGTPSSGAPTDYVYIGFLPFLTNSDTTGADIWLGCRVLYTEGSAFSRTRTVFLPKKGSTPFGSQSYAVSSFAASTPVLSIGCSAQLNAGSILSFNNVSVAAANASGYQTLTGAGSATTSDFINKIVDMRNGDPLNRVRTSVLATTISAGLNRPIIYNPSGIAEVSTVDINVIPTVLDDYPTAKFFTVNTHILATASGSTTTMRIQDRSDKPAEESFPLQPGVQSAVTKSVTYQRQHSSFSYGYIYHTDVAATVNLFQQIRLVAVQEDLMNPAPIAISSMEV